MASSSYDPVLEAFCKAKNDFLRSLDLIKDRKVRDRLTQNAHTAESVWQYIDELQRDQGNRRCLQGLSRIGSYIERLQEYSRLIEVFVQVKPEVLALIWGPIKLLLQITSNIAKSFDAILDVMKDLGPAMPDFSKLGDLFRDNPRLKHVLSLYFTDILEFYLTSLKFFTQSKSGLFFEALWPTIRAKIDVITKNIENHALLLYNELTLADIIAAHEFRQKALKEFEDSKDFRDRQDFDSLKSYISPPNYDSRLAEIDVDRCEGTGGWLLSDPSFTKWLDSASSTENVLWLQGIPGAGKTYLAFTVVHETRKRGKTLSVFLRHDQELATCLPVLHALIFQLADSDRDLRNALCTSVLHGPVDFKRELRSDSQFVFDILAKLMRCAEETHVVIDGLDEINEMLQGILLQKLLDLVKDHSNMRLLISSRPEYRIERLLQDRSMLIKVQERNSGSIQRFIRLWVQDWLLESTFGEKDRAYIRHLLAPLAAKAQGMFLYARIVLDSIKFLNNISSIQEELIVLPENLHEAYGRIIDRINRLPEAAQRDSKRILGWIAFSSHLTRREMEQALLITSETLKLPRVQSTLNPLRLCGPLVEVQDERLVFIHFTVKEYLTKDQNNTFISPRSAILDLAMTCLRYLSLDIFDINHDALDDCDDVEDSEYDGSQVSDTFGNKIEAAILSGAYRLHRFAYCHWTSLVKQSINSYLGEPLPEELVHLLERFTDQRVNDDYHDASENTSVPHALENLKRCPEIQLQLSRFLDFNSRLRTSSDWRLDEADMNSPWAASDPTTLSIATIFIHQATEQLACSLNTHGQNCPQACEMLSEHYGPRVFRCHFVGCPFQRLGFSLKSDRDHHVQHHSRPFKCTVSSCEYSHIGFLSQEQCDTHWYKNHSAAPQPNGKELVQGVDEDEIIPLFFDLVRRDQLESVRSLLPHWEKATGEFRDLILDTVAAEGSVSMAKLLHLGAEFDGHHVKKAMEAKNIPIARLLCKKYKILMGRRRRTDDGITKVIMQSDSNELFDILRENILKFDRVSISFSSPSIFSRTNSVQESRLLMFWKDQILRGRVDQSKLNDAVKNVAEHNCSLNIARTLVECGGDVDAGAAKTSGLSPLHVAAKKTTEAAARLMEFLLLAGADPYRGFGRGVRVFRPGDEKGARGISKWLGKTWEELVAWAQEERRKAGLTGSNEDKGKLPPGW
ncbi:hypothetical protein QBC44DRAFT_271432 [Cladorrhinum sp. PSN332]|nr:hypothetical protein QBC44DRAFT_271432 [Cladorrhinum sp. PSN332]